MGGFEIEYLANTMMFHAIKVAGPGGFDLFDTDSPEPSGDDTTVPLTDSHYVGTFGNDIFVETGSVSRLYDLFAGDDTLTGGAGADMLSGGANADVLDGMTSDRTVPGAAGRASTLSGGGGQDRLILGTSDIGIGGDEPDTFAVDRSVMNDRLALVADLNPVIETIKVEFFALSPGQALPELQIVDFADGSGANVVLGDHVVALITGAQGLDQGGDPADRHVMFVRGHNALCDPSHSGDFALALQPQKNTVLSVSAVNFIGVKSLPLWVPSQNGCFAD